MFRAGKLGGRGRPGGRLQPPAPPAGRQEDLPALPQVQAPVNLLPHLQQAAQGNNPPVEADAVEVLNQLVAQAIQHLQQPEAAPQLGDQVDNQDVVEVLDQPVAQAIIAHLQQLAFDNLPVGNYLEIEAAPHLGDQVDNQDALLDQQVAQANAPPVWYEMDFQPNVQNLNSREREEIKRLHNIARSLLNHLMHTQRYSNEAKQLLTSRSFSLRVDFRRLKRENKQLAYDICNNYWEPQMQGFIADAFRQFLLRQLELDAADYHNVDDLMDGINQHPRISFPRIPRSIQSFSEFLEKQSPVGAYDLFQGSLDSVQVLDVDPQAHRYLRKGVQNVLNTHRKGFCWNDIDPKRRIGRAGSQEDLNRIAVEVLPRFSAIRRVEDPHTGNQEEEDIYLAYMLHLVLELSPYVDPNNPEGPVRQNGDDLLDKDYYGWYYDFLMYHPSLLPPKARKIFIYGLYEAVYKLQYKRRYPFTTVFDKSMGWTQFFQDRQHRILEAIYEYDPRPQDAAQQPQDAAYYQNYVQDMLKFLRHVLEHAYDHALIDPPTNTQSIRSGNESELFAAENFPRFFPDLLKRILGRGCLKGDILSHWRIYVANSDAEV